MDMDIERTMAFLLENQARFDQAMDRLTRIQIDSAERHEREMAQASEEMAKIRAELRRAVQMAVEETRRERQRRQDMYAELHAAQQVTEEKLQRLIDHLDRRA